MLSVLLSMVHVYVCVAGLGGVHSQLHLAGGVLVG